MTERYRCEPYQDKWIIPSNSGLGFGQVPSKILVGGRPLNEDEREVIVFSSESRIVPGHPTETIVYIGLPDVPSDMKVEIEV